MTILQVTEADPCLLAACRRWWQQPQLRIHGLQCQALAGGLSGSLLERCCLTLSAGEKQWQWQVIHKRGAVVQGAFMRGASRREALFYRHLAPRLPLGLPTVFAADCPGHDIWMLPFAASKASDHWHAAWSAVDVRRCLHDLARLHSGYWAQTSSLNEYHWLAQPTHRDADALLTEARNSLQILLAEGNDDPLLTPTRLQQWLRVANQPQAMLAILNEAPATLLHGDAGFQNIAIRMSDGKPIWFDWQLVSTGPAVLDLVTFIHPWTYATAHPPMPAREMLHEYEQALGRFGIRQPADMWARQFDAALLWRWLSQWAPLVGQHRHRLRPKVRDRLYHVFKRLHWLALDRWIADQT